MNEINQRKRILLIGSYPPPVGGCSVHIQRLKKLLQDQNDVWVIDLYGVPVSLEDQNVYRCGTNKILGILRAGYYLRTLMPNIAHFHVSAMKNFMYVGKLLMHCLPPSCEKIITIHSGSFVPSYKKLEKLKQLMLSSLLLRFDHLIAVNQIQRDLLFEIGCPPKRISVIPAFLPPHVVSTSHVVNIISGITIQNRRILVTSGYGLDYYGYHHIAAALEVLGEKTRGMNLIVCLYNSYDERYLEIIERRLSSIINLTIFKDLGPDEFSYILSKSDVYIRATDRDGDSVAIREAAYFGKKVVASSAVNRPDGAILFRLGDPDDLAGAINKALNGNNESPLGDDDEKFVGDLLNVYESFDNRI
jgi:hypothetical protein